MLARSKHLPLSEGIFTLSRSQRHSHSAPCLPCTCDRTSRSPCRQVPCLVSKSSHSANYHTSTSAILCCVGGFFALFTTVGFLNAWGIFQDYYHRHQLPHKSESEISWIGSFASFAVFMGAPPAGLLADKIGPTVRFDTIIRLFGHRC